MEHFPNGSAFSYFKLHRFDESLAWDFLRHCSMGLLEMARLKIVHRDLTPANILVRTELTGSLSFVIADLGNAFVLAAPTFPRGCGTHAFASPESLADPSRFTMRSDVFSLGMTVLYLLRQGLPYGFEWNSLLGVSIEARSAAYSAIYNKKGEFKHEDLCPNFPSYSFEFLHLLRRMLRIEPASRFDIERVSMIASDLHHHDVKERTLEIDVGSIKRLSNNKEVRIKELESELTESVRGRGETALRLFEIQTELHNDKRESINQISDLNAKLQEVTTERDNLLKESNDYKLQITMTTEQLSSLQRDRDRLAASKSELESSIIVKDAMNEELLDNLREEKERSSAAAEKEKELVDLRAIVSSSRTQAREMSKNVMQLMAAKNLTVNFI